MAAAAASPNSVPLTPVGEKLRMATEAILERDPVAQPKEEDRGGYDKDSRWLQTVPKGIILKNCGKVFKPNKGDNRCTKGKAGEANPERIK